MGSGIAWAGHRRAKFPPSLFTKVPRCLESDMNFGVAPPIGSARTKGCFNGRKLTKTFEENNVVNVKFVKDLWIKPTMV